MKQTMITTVLSGLLTGSLLSACIPFTAAAAEAPYTYTVLNDGTAAVSCTDPAIVHAEIPSEIDGYTISALSEACFKDCTALEDVTFPSSLVQVQDYAFQNCSALETFTVPETVTSIGSFVFEGCTALQAIEVAEASEYFTDDGGILYDKTMQTLVRYPAAKTDLTYVTPDTCKTISPWAFTDCSHLQSLEMQSVTAIGADAFFCASSLQTVKLSEGITELIGATFSYCVNLRKLTLPTSLKSIGDKCFYGCVSLPSVTFPEQLTEIGEMAFYGCVQIKEMDVPDSVRSIGDMALGYSIDPDTNENTVIEGFSMKTVSGSQAQRYAKKHQIPHEAAVRRSTVMLISIVVIVLGIAAAAEIMKLRQNQKQHNGKNSKKKRQK